MPASQPAILAQAPHTLPLPLRHADIYVHIYIYVCMYIYIYIHIYIYGKKVFSSNTIKRKAYRTSTDKAT